MYCLDGKFAYYVIHEEFDRYVHTTKIKERLKDKCKSSNLPSP